jgi:hypothetical protein
MLARAHLGALRAAVSSNRLDVADRHLEQVRRLLAEHGTRDRWGDVSLARAEADVAMRSGSRADLDRAAEHLRAELTADLADVDRADTLLSLGEVEGERGEADAVAVLGQAVELLRRSPPDGVLAAALSSLAEHDLRADDDVAAARDQQESMYLAAELALPGLLGSAFVIAARLAERLGVEDAAIRLHGAAEVLYEEVGFVLLPSDQALSDAMRARVRQRLGAERVDALTREGRALDRDAAMALADEVFGRFPV